MIWNRLPGGGKVRAKIQASYDTKLPSRGESSRATGLASHGTKRPHWGGNDRVSILASYDAKPASRDENSRALIHASSGAQLPHWGENNRAMIHASYDKPKLVYTTSKSSPLFFIPPLVSIAKLVLL